MSNTMRDARFAAWIQLAVKDVIRQDVEGRYDVQAAIAAAARPLVLRVLSSPRDGEIF